MARDQRVMCVYPARRGPWSDTDHTLALVLGARAGAGAGQDPAGALGPTLLVLEWVML